MDLKMDFRLDKLSWVMMFVMVGVFMYFMLEGAGGEGSVILYLEVFALAVLTLVVLLGLMSIPVLIVCYFINKIPDIDYSVWVAFAFTMVGLISELI